AVQRVVESDLPLVYVNQICGQDELVFDGHSVVLDDAGEVVARAPGFEEHLLVVDVEPTVYTFLLATDASRPAALSAT
ncbi:MAG: NAD+ synthase, partial [Nitrospirae bacterium]|nr:NAD+ synthase [Nitrospirota bacterium]